MEKFKCPVCLSTLEIMLSPPIGKYPCPTCADIKRIHNALGVPEKRILEIYRLNQLKPMVYLPIIIEVLEIEDIVGFTIPFLERQIARYEEVPITTSVLRRRLDAVKQRLLQINQE